MRERDIRRVGLALAGALLATLVAVVPPVGAADTEASSVDPWSASFGLGTVLDRDGRGVGDLIIFDDGDTTLIDLQVEGLPPGRHGVVLHERGSCNAPYTASGPPIRAIALPDIQTSGPDGFALLEAILPSVRLADLLDDDDFSVVIYSLPDNAANIPARYGGPDAVTLATGDVGDGLACAVIEGEDAGDDEGVHRSALPNWSHAAAVQGQIRRRLQIGAERETSTDLVRADLLNDLGRPAGTASMLPDPGGDVVQVVVHGLAPGVHGVQLHQSGACTAPGFESTGTRLASSALPNVVVGPSGVGMFVVAADLADVGAMLAGDGTSIVVHELADNAANVPARYLATGTATPGPDDESRATGDAGAAVACGMLRSVPSVERYLDVLYDLVLSRPPSKAAVGRWSAHLQRGGTRLSLVHSLMASVEGLENLVSALYEYFDAPVTEAQLRYWVTYLRRPGSDIDVVYAHVLASEAYFSQFEGDTREYVYSVYSDIFASEEEIDDAQVDLVATWLDGGGSRLALATWLLHTDRYRVSVIAGYLGFDDEYTFADVAKWLRHMRRGGDWRPMQEQILASESFYRYSIDPSNGVGGGLGAFLFDS